jgi:glutathione S-transferase
MKAYIHPASPNCVAVLALARELGAPLATVTVDLFARANNAPEFLSINPNGLVPVLIDGDFALWETTAILQYLATAEGAREWFPDDARGRADVTRWQAWGLAHWQPVLQTFIYQNLFKRLRGLGDADPLIVTEALPKLERLAGILEAQLQRRPWVCGEHATVADLSLGAYLVYADPAHIPLGNFEHLSMWWSRLRERPAWAAAQDGVLRLPNRRT